jgi:hypothetical protein
MNSYVFLAHFYAIGHPPKMSPIFIVLPNKNYVYTKKHTTVYMILFPGTIMEDDAVTASWDKTFIMI